MEEMVRRHNPILIPQYIFPYLKRFILFFKNTISLRNEIVTKYIVIQISRLISLVDNLKSLLV